MYTVHRKKNLKDTTVRTPQRRRTLTSANGSSTLCLRQRRRPDEQAAVVNDTRLCLCEMRPIVPPRTALRQTRSAD